LKLWSPCNLMWTVISTWFLCDCLGWEWCLCHSTVVVTNPLETSSNERMKSNCMRRHPSR
jgi:hypothetical protein